MKIIGKGKAPKAWCLIQNVKTGHYYVGYDGEWPVHGNVAQVQAKVDEAKAYITANPRPVALPDVPFPGHFSHKQRLEDQPQTYQDAHKAYTEAQASRYALRQWEAMEEISNCAPLDDMPIFEDELAFVGYTRGRSSVTMQFEASNGQIIEFGPSGINGLIQGIIDGTCSTQVLAGTHEVQGEWNPAKQAYEPGVIEPRGKGIKATFKFTKKGQNVYAELVEV